ncbi:hypothetical protein [Serinicoccus kebangsaanensis]|uniref:hypothetical protein n=1 Tax=Serinicoccus kebangsaanensis TaxID=2602069 RepID=UPI00124F283B|nr:hypothetical protein [Serinicoccus kebangsaanensis]
MSPPTSRARRPRLLTACLLVGSLLLTGCSGSDDGEDQATSSASPTTGEAAGEPSGSEGAEPTGTDDAGASPTSGTDGGDSAGSDEGETDPEASVSVTTAAEPTAVGEFEYEDVPEPAPQEVETLCNLTRDYFVGQRDASLVDGRVSESMQLTVVGLSDQVGIWTGLQEQYPDAAEDIRRAGVILQHWDNALAASQQGLTAEEAAYLSEANELIEQLPSQAAVSEVGCDR